jgi:threonyl-tRNA synthetase
LGEKDQKSLTLGEAVAALTDEALPPDVRRAKGLAPAVAA